VKANPGKVWDKKFSSKSFYRVGKELKQGRHDSW
jgi:hypothetical protein